MAHSHHAHREHQVAHRRVDHILKDEPAGARNHAKSDAFSKVTSKTAAEQHDKGVTGAKGAKRYARGGGVKHKGHQTNIAIVMPHRSATPDASAPMAGPTAGPPPPMPMAGGPAPSPMGGPPGMPPGMPMRARGGKIAGGADTPANLKKMAKRASDNSYFRGGAASGVGREEKAEHMKRGK